MQSTRAFLTAALLCVALSVLGQGTAQDYARAKDLRRRTENKVFKTQLTAHWLTNSARFWYRNDLAGGAREFVLVDAEKATRQPAIDHERLAARLTQVLGT